MTRKVFWEDPYCTELEAIITGIEGNNVRFDQTIFHPISGCQECDHGTLANKKVVAQYTRWERS